MSTENTNTSDQKPCAFQGILTPDSPMRDIFKDGFVPIQSPFPVKAILGMLGEQEVYMLAKHAITPAQSEAMAQAMAARGLGTIDQARDAMANTDDIPLRLIHFTGTSFPLRYVI